MLEIIEQARYDYMTNTTDIIRSKAADAVLTAIEKAGMLPPFVENTYPEFINDSYFWEPEDEI